MSDGTLVSVPSFPSTADPELLLCREQRNARLENGDHTCSLMKKHSKYRSLSACLRIINHGMASPLYSRCRQQLDHLKNGAYFYQRKTSVLPRAILKSSKAQWPGASRRYKPQSTLSQSPPDSSEAVPFRTISKRD